ncbi:Nif11-like leader peptide family natural product precursor [Nostoc sp.]|uniref:Nif11-like leader peptide family natural product precursor n=1 Tax=Nostoc sp. TaxID=1180 RepID=UPI002FF513D7
MSVDNAKAFYDKVTTNEALQTLHFTSDRILWSDSWQDKPKSTCALARGVI